MGTHHDPKKVVRVGRGQPFGGDPYVDHRTGISTENHHQIYARLVAAGPTMHGTPKERVKKSH